MNTETETDLGDHVHAHGVPGPRLKSDVKVPPGQTDLQLLETGKPIQIEEWI
jgi:hypothetical protein